VGEALIEIVVSIVIIGLTVTALLSGLATVGNAGTAQRNSVRADVEMRNYAEAIKGAAQRCVAGQPFPALIYTPSPSYTATGAPTFCPSIPTGPVTTLTVVRLTITGPLNKKSFMDMKVRTP
jgi:type II secretory pathway pseudopilin PulG